MAFPGQLYAYALWHLAGAAALFLLDACRVALDGGGSGFGSGLGGDLGGGCGPSERVMARICAVAALHAGILFATLTYRSSTDHARKNALTPTAIHGATAVLAAAVMAGGGGGGAGALPRPWLRSLLVLGGMAQTAALASSGEEGGHLIPPSAVRDGLGLNPKTLLAAAATALAGGVAAGAVGTVPFPTSLLGPEAGDLTDAALLLWNAASVFALEASLALWHSVVYDDPAGQEAMLGALYVLSLASGAALAPLGGVGLLAGGAGFLDPGLALAALGALTAVFALAVAGGRCCAGRRGGYEGIQRPPSWVA